MIKKLINLFSFLSLLIGIMMLPGALRLPIYKRASWQGVETIQDAIARCKLVNLEGWGLVGYAQRLTSEKFSIYSTLNVWDTPKAAFLHGMGYCTQYNLALKQILDGLGFQTQAVFSFKIRDLDDPTWTMGHTWLRVTIEGETRDVCAGNLNNKPGDVRFEPLWPVLNGRYPTLFLTHVGLIFFCGVLEWKALLTGTPPPEWSYQELK